jgi:hypothetical protein
MNKTVLKGGALGLLLSATLAGCNDDGTTVPPAKQPPPATTNFKMFTDNQVQQATCETLATTEVNGLDFAFPMDEDTADAAEVSMISPACTVS